MSQSIKVWSIASLLADLALVQTLGCWWKQGVGPYPCCFSEERPDFSKQPNDPVWCLINPWPGTVVLTSPISLHGGGKTTKKVVINWGRVVEQKCGDSLRLHYLRKKCHYYIHTNKVNKRLWSLSLLNADTGDEWGEANSLLFYFL